MDFPERILRDAAVHERFVDECDFAARADDAEVGVRQAEHLLLDNEIAGMAVRHHDNIVLGGERYGLGNVIIIADYSVLSSLEEGNVGKGGAVVKHYAAKIDRAEHRRECLRDMSAAEDHNAVKERQRLGVIAACDNGVRRTERGALFFTDALAAEQTFFTVKTRHAAVERENEPAMSARLDAVAYGAREQAPSKIVGIHIRKEHRNVAAALHTDVLFLVGTEHKLMHGAPAGFQKLHRLFLRLEFHGAAADRAGDAALFADKHRGAGAARRAAAVGDDSYEHDAALFFDFVKQLGKNPSHDGSS